MHNFISLSLKCSSCGKSIMDSEKLVDNESSIKLIIETPKNKGIIRLSSVYGSYNHISDIIIQDNEIVKFFCPHCKNQITSKNNCETCGALMVTFNIKMGGQVSICPRKGCKKHFIEFSDNNVALKNLYEQYGLNGKNTEDDD
ncbi:MAG: class I tRNA ligase family protein [Bacteroidetes bacterium]|nr:class I tRNA ligase family protein [Bacteroidota bacterium]